jgi:predicted permease
MIAFVFLFGLTKSLGAQALVTVALPAAVPATILAGRYKVYEAEAASLLILTSFLIIGIVPFFQYLAGFL